uniref:hypothetical protein n=1 Tax=Kineococcus terrestris TaxID=2044856 RepID=UPI0035A16424
MSGEGSSPGSPGTPGSSRGRGGRGGKELADRVKAAQAEADTAAAEFEALLGRIPNVVEDGV